MRRPGIWVANGSPGDVSQMYSWRPGAVAGLFDYLVQNDVAGYKAAYPNVPVIVRFAHPQNWHQNSTESARRLGQAVAAAWPQMQALDPYVYFANHLNLHYENGDPNPANQPQYTTPEFYKKYAHWVRLTADVIKNAVPEMKLVAPPFAFGFNEDGSPTSSGEPIAGWAGYDYLWETIRDYFDNILTFHAYWGYASGGSVPDWLYEPELSSWYAFRWQRVLQLFQNRYGQNARVIIDKAANYGPADPDFPDQLIYFAQQCLRDSRVLAVAFFLWKDSTADPRYRLNDWTAGVPNLPALLNRLAVAFETSSAPETYIRPDATDLTGIMDYPEPAPLLQPPPPPTTPAGTHTIRVLFEDGNVREMLLEEYLRGVVPGEVPAKWPLEALKAQAVASRSYAQYAIEHPRHHPTADICTTTHCQHYNPAKIDDRSDDAIRQTHGLILQYNGSTVNTVFSARCGGHTRNNEDVWTQGRPLPYLRGVSCPDVAEKHGHGVGMCQHGARVFAEQGKTFDQILHHYYQSTQLETIPEKS